MKLVTIGIEDGVYENFIKFLSVLDSEKLKIYEELTIDDLFEINRLNKEIDKNNFSEFKSLEDFLGEV